MKKLLSLTYLLLSSFLILFSGCDKPDKPSPCLDAPIQHWVNPSNLWLLEPIKASDTFKFMIYFKDKANGSKYIYRKDAIFYVSDTVTQKIKIKNQSRDVNCNEYAFDNNKIAKANGPDTLKFQLEAGPITEFDIFFHEKKFSIGSDQYNYHKSGWLDKLNVSGKDYYDIKLLYGFDLGDNDGTGYKDSTIIFYNLQYGILKSIVNDTLIYLRKP